MGGLSIDSVKAKILDRLSGLSLEKVILFGSAARGEWSDQSDLDLYVVTRDDRIPANWGEKNEVYLSVARKLRDMRHEVPLDLIVHTKAMHRRFIELNSSIAREILRDGIVLYG